MWLDHDGVTFRTNLRKMAVLFVDGVAGYHLWRRIMIVHFGHAAYVEHPYAFAAALAAVLATEVHTCQHCNTTSESSARTVLENATV